MEDRKDCRPEPLTPEQYRERRRVVNNYPKVMTLLDSPELRAQLATVDMGGVEVLHYWRSRYFTAALYDHGSGVYRLTINRAHMRMDGHYEDGITWDEMMQVKRELSFGNRIGIEFYPEDDEVINVRNERHIWFFPNGIMNAIRPDGKKVDGPDGLGS